MSTPLRGKQVISLLLGMALVLWLSATPGGAGLNEGISAYYGGDVSGHRGSEGAHLAKMGSEADPFQPAMQTSGPLAHSADHLVRLEEDDRGDGEPEGLGGLEVDDQLKFRGLLHREVSRFGAFQDLIDIRGGAAEQEGVGSGYVEFFPTVGFVQNNSFLDQHSGKLGRGSSHAASILAPMNRDVKGTVLSASFRATID